MTNNLEIVTATNEDEIKQIAALARAVWIEHFTPIIGAKQVEYMLNRFQSADAIAKQISDGGYTYFRLVVDGELVGYTATRDDDGLFMSKLYLKKAARKHGYARVAMEFLKSRCRDKGFERVWLTVNKRNESSIAVYRHFGFTVFHEEATDIGNGMVMDDYHMELRI